MMHRGAKMPAGGSWQCSTLKRQSIEDTGCSSIEPSWSCVNFPEADDCWHFSIDNKSQCATLLTLDTSSPKDKHQIFVSAGNYFGGHTEHHHQQQQQQQQQKQKQQSSPQAQHSRSSSSSQQSSQQSTRSWSWRTAGGEELAALVAQKSVGCIANCDLPPAASTPGSSQLIWKTTSNLESTASTATKPSSNLSTRTPTMDSQQRAVTQRSLSSSSGWLGGDLLGEILCRPQSGAEKLTSPTLQDKEKLMRLFFREASVSFAYRQWLISLQAENMCLKMCQAARQQQFPLWSSSSHGKKRRRTKQAQQQHNSNRDSDALVIAFALGLGLASAGLLLGLGMGWIMFAA